ncbi:MAG: CaiB/BaiF CoA transferase family protein, partial [Dehalococcoidia bacterium]
AYCLNKRGITLDLESPEGQGLFRRLATGADFVLGSFPPGYMDRLGIGYESLTDTNPGLIMTSITPFGQTGPHAQYRATDIVAWSMGGMQYISGDEDRPPVRISFPQAELHAGAQAAAGSMVAFWHRQRTGEGQQVDVSMQEAVIWTLMNATSFPLLHKETVERAGASRKMGFLVLRGVFPCKDGYVSALVVGGVLGAVSTSAIVRWMDEEGLAPDFMKDRDWAAWDFAAVVAQGEEGVKDIQTVERHVGDFFLTKTKAQLYERAITDRILLAPCNTVEDTFHNPQLRAREFWVEVYHPELYTSLTYPGPYIKLSETPIEARRRAPLIGEHNEELYIDELGLTSGQLKRLKRQGTI